MSLGHIRDMWGAAQNILELDPLSIIARHKLLTRMSMDQMSESTKKWDKETLHYPSSMEEVGEKIG
jgi:hypothetical protein